MSKTTVFTKENGLDVIFRHDYDDLEIMRSIAEYTVKSCQYLEKFLDNVVGSKNFKSYLDVGCANTISIDYFSKLFSECRGLDLYPATSDPRIIEGDFYKLSECINSPVDVVFCNHTLEHSYAPKLLEQFNKIQPIGGVLFIAVPDCDYSWAYDITQSTSHWCIFNEGFLRTLVSRYGYEVSVSKQMFRDQKGELFLVGIKRWTI